jgi:hypothetical protein
MSEMEICFLGPNLSIFSPNEIYFVFTFTLQAWRSEFQQSFPHEQVALFLGMFGSLGGLYKVYKFGSFYFDIALYLTWSVMHSALLLYFIHSRPTTFYKHREAILTCTILSRILVYYLYVLYTPSFLEMLPLELPATPFKAAIHLFKVPALVLLLLVDLITTYNTSRINALICTVFLAFYSINRCESELGAVPGQGQRYQEIAVAIEGTIHQYMPFAPSRRFTPGLDEYQACLLCKNTAQILVAYTLPLTIIFVLEKIFRNKFKRENCVEFSISYSNAELIARYFLLVPLQTVLVFQFLVLLIKWKF